MRFAVLCRRSAPGISHSLRHRFANSLGVIYRAHSCYGVPEFWLAPGLDGGGLALPQERVPHIPFAQTPLRELARCDIPGTLLLGSAWYSGLRLISWGALALPQERVRHVPFAQTPLRELARCDTPDTLLLRRAGRLVSARFGWG